MWKSKKFGISCALLALFAAGQAAALEINQKVENDDGSVTILEPRFQIDGEQKLVSDQTPAQGICAKYGFDQGTFAFASGDHPEPTVVLTTEGQFKEYRSYGTNYSNSWIRGVVCRSSSQSMNKISARAKISQNDDGSFSITNPSFSAVPTAIGGMIMPISDTSDLEGVCRLYGLAGAILRSVRASGDLKEGTAIIGASGFFSKTRSYGDRYRNAKLDSLVCQKKLNSVLSLELGGKITLANLPTSLEFISAEVYSYKGAFISEIAAGLNRYAPLDGQPTEIYDSPMARQFVLNAIRPFMEEIDSPWFKQEIAPKYAESLKAHNGAEIRGLSSFDDSRSVKRMSIVILVAGLSAIEKISGSDLDKAKIVDLKTKAGFAAASNLGYSQMKQVLDAFRAHEASFTRMLGDPRLKGIVTTMTGVLEYLESRYN